MANPFYVQPVDLTQGFGQLGQGMQAIARRQQIDKQEAQQLQQQEANQARMTELQSIVQTGDMDKVADFMIANPDMQSNVQNNIYKAMGVKDEIQSEQMKRDTFNMLSKPQQVPQLLESRIAEIELRGGDATQTKKELAEFATDPKGFMQSLEGIAASSYSPEYKQWSAAMRGEPEKDNRTSKMIEWDEYNQLKQTDPEAAKQFGLSAGFINKETGTEAKPTANAQDWSTYTKMKKTDPEGAKQFGQKVGFVKPDGKELSVHLQKRLSTATDNAIKSESNAESYDGIASEFEDMDVGGGLFAGKWSEAFKDVTGSQDAVTALRKQYLAIRGSQVVNNLPPGAASDKDIEMALSGFPSENATGEQISSFMRGLAKVERHKAAFESFKANYISENGNEKGMVKAWKSEQKKKPADMMTDEELLADLGL